MFTKEQIEEIAKRLGIQGIRDTQFDQAKHPLNGTEVIAIVQSGRNRLIRVDDFAEEIANYISIEKAQSDWLQEEETAPDYIKHKPTISDQTITINQGSDTWSFTLNQDHGETISLAEGGGGGGGLKNAFSTMKVGTSTANAVNGDTFEFVEGSNVTLSLSDKKLTISSTGGGVGDVGNLNTYNSASLAPSSSESFGEDINLHKIAKTGKYSDLLDIDAYTKSEIDAMLEAINARIDAINAKLSGITIYASSRTIYVGEEAAIVVQVTCTDTASSMTLYRNNTELHTFGSGDTWTYTDEFTPSSFGTITYKAVATVGVVDKENQIDVEVIKKDATLYWSPSTATAYLNYGSNVYPTLNNPNLLNVTYSSSVAGVATINSSGQVSLVGTGTTIISATYNGESASSRYNSKTASYTLKVEDDTVTGLTWDRGGVSSYTVNVYGNTNFNRGTVTASWASGKTPTNVTSIATFNTEKSNQGSKIQGTKYYAPTNAGTDVISVSYGNMTAPETVSVTVQRITTNLQWSEDTWELTLGDTPYTFPDLTGDENLPARLVVYSSSDSNVATIDVYTGEVDVRGMGTCTITASIPANGQYTQSSDSYTLTIINPEPGPEPPGPEPPGPTTIDYYAGWATGANSGYDAFAALTAEQLIALSTSYSKSEYPTYNKTVTAADLPSNRQIFFLMWKNGSAPQSGTITSVGIPTYYSAADFLDPNQFDATHNAITIGGDTYTVAGYRGSFDPNDSIVINF